MGQDRFIRWKKPRPEWGEPTLDKLAQVASDFLGTRWTVRKTGDFWLVCECDDLMTFSLRSQRDDLATEGKNKGKKTVGDIYHEDMQKRTRGFEVFHLVEKGRIKQTSVVTRQADEFTGALADRYAEIIARWWSGEVEWPG